jgi:hypothetical protein
VFFDEISEEQQKQIQKKQNDKIGEKKTLDGVGPDCVNNKGVCMEISTCISWKMNITSNCLIMGERAVQVRVMLKEQ